MADAASNEDLAPEVLSVNSDNERAQNVFMRHESECDAMGSRQRCRNNIRSFFRRLCCNASKPAEAPEAVGESDDSDLEEGAIKQYRLEATRRNKQGFFRSIFFCFCPYKRGGRSAVGISSNQALAQYLHWMFRINFFFLFALCCFVFFCLTFIFAGFIVWAGKADSQCVRIGGEEFNMENTAFADAFALSWTTFSTVGYGSTYPALGPENENRTNCAFITAICSLESFIGVLYSGFCGAILFGKVLRIQSHAQVIFSDPIVIRYGTGVETPADMHQQTDPNEKGKKQYPCPVLEFRIVNRLFNDVGGEIMDATLNAVASVDAKDADPSIRESVDADRRRFLRVRDESGRMVDTEASSDYSGSSRFSDRVHTTGRAFFDPVTSILSSMGRRDHQAIEEDPTSRLVSKRIFSKMLIEASEHPFFKRVWLARHILDDTSPLLTQKARRAIRRNGGFWPEHLNSYDAVRSSLEFNQILVSLNGVSNVSAADVYSQKIYDYNDVNIGYQFVNLLYRDGSDGALKVDTTLINDVKEQAGGGGEPLMLGE